MSGFPNWPFCFFFFFFHSIQVMGFAYSFSKNDIIHLISKYLIAFFFIINQCQLISKTFQQIFIFKFTTKYFFYCSLELLFYFYYFFLCYIMFSIWYLSVFLAVLQVYFFPVRVIGFLSPLHFKTSELTTGCYPILGFISSNKLPHPENA